MSGKLAIIAARARESACSLSNSTNGGFSKFEQESCSCSRKLWSFVSEPSCGSQAASRSWADRHQNPLTITVASSSSPKNERFTSNNKSEDRKKNKKTKASLSAFCFRITVYRSICVSPAPALAPALCVFVCVLPFAFSAFILESRFPFIFAVCCAFAFLVQFSSFRFISVHFSSFRFTSVHFGSAHYLAWL